jgi:hypothetical protein
MNRAHAGLMGWLGAVAVLYALECVRRLRDDHPGRRHPRAPEYHDAIATRVAASLMVMRLLPRTVSTIARFGAEVREKRVTVRVPLR